MMDNVVGRGALGVFLLRYGNYFPYTSLLIQSVKATHYFALEKDFDDFSEFLHEVRRTISEHMGYEVSTSQVLFLLRSERRSEIVGIITKSISLERIERVISSIYVTFVTCLAAGLSENAAKFGLGVNVSSVISHSLFRIVCPLLPQNQPLSSLFTKAICTSLGIYCAFKLEKSLLVWANCLLGADLLIGAVECIYKKSPQTSQNEAAEPVESVTTITSWKFRSSLVWTLAGVGLAWQFFPGDKGNMSVWMKGVLVGPRMVEYGLQTLSVWSKGKGVGIS